MKLVRTIVSTAIVGTTISLMACSATELSSQAKLVMVSPNQPPKGCKYLGQVTGNQGNFFTGAYTSNSNLESGAMNDLKNKANNLGGNYVQLVTNRAGDTGGGAIGGTGGGFAQTNVTDLGNVYSCPDSVKTW
jgi:hypothetical protein